MYLSEKQKPFPKLFVPYLESTSNFKRFEKKKMIVIDNVFPKLETVKIFARKVSQGHRFRTRFGSEHVKSSQLLAISP